MLPVLIVGAGPVGLGTALLLARWGVPTVVVEARDGPDPMGSRAICLQRDVLDIFDRMGCAEAMVAEGVTWSVGRTYYRDRELFTTEFPDAGRSAFPPWINLSQATTEGHLRKRVEETPLVDVRYGARVTALIEGTADVEVTLETAAGTDRLRGSHLIGADGTRSTVRHLLGIGYPGRSFSDQFLIVDVRADLPFPNERRFYFDPPWNPGRQVLVHAQPNRVFRIDWQVPPDYDVEAARVNGELDALIRRITGDVPYEIDWLSVYRFHERCAERFQAGRVFLAGDAAHVVAPFGARGLNSGIQDAENLAWKLGFVRHGLVDGPAAGLLLDSYDTERRAAACENVRVTSATMEFLVPQTDAEWGRRRAALERAVADPSACSAINSGKLAEPYWYCDSPLTTPGGTPDGFPTGPGQARPPVAGVLCPDGPCTIVDLPRVRRLRALFGDGFVVLVAATAALEAARQATAGALGAIPHRVLALDEIDREGVIRTALCAGPDTVHAVRPDGHFAAVLPAFDSEALAGALRRVCALPVFTPAP
jgi:2-polyprenyl-6-methoxyphenol hydroxylase-like FAD-dependent oxidoreductase